MTTKPSPKDVLAAIKQEDLAELARLFRQDPQLPKLQTPFGSWLHVAAEYSKPAVAKYLVEHGLDIEQKSGVAGGTAINIAASEGCSEIVAYLLERGATLDVSAPERNPLFSAIYGGHAELVAILLDAGIDATVRYTGPSMKNMDAAAFARERGQAELARLVEAHIDGERNAAQKG